MVAIYQDPVAIYGGMNAPISGGGPVDPPPVGGPTVLDSQGLPNWLPAPGSFVNISNNTLAEAYPSGWPKNDSAGPFSNWASGVLAYDFGDMGAYVVHGSGHLPVGLAMCAGVWCFDLKTRNWVGRNVPVEPLVEQKPNTAFYNQYFESVIPATAGHTYAPHTYDGLGYQSTAMGGGPDGSLLRISMGGAEVGAPVHKFDLSSLTAPPTRVVDNLGGNSYPMSAVDEARGGFWYLSNNGNGPLKFVKFSDWSMTTYPGVEFNINNDDSMVYVPAPWDMLVCFGRGGPYDFDQNYMIYYSRLVNNVPQPFQKVTTNVTGERQTDPRSGGVWSTLLNCIVSYEGASSTRVHRLTPPDPATNGTGVWTWSHETLTGVSGAVPSRSMSNDNGAWSRMIEVPQFKCFLWCDSVQGPVQAWRLQGM